jgi:lipopolysaccharide transport system ATP-binding protein
MEPILEIQDIGKRFMINHEQQSYLSLREKISGIFKPSFPKQEFWALKDISFNVFPGESIGIIGKNGAGKSTLLKILSKITPPSTGRIISRGRIASLLEVGTGFHPELTGRENVFMNGSILGMRKKEILKNFDAIVDFAGVEKFIDTPLKHYSSGMQLRLAFAVAAFLENEILIIDEVLAVGDAEFQKKCLGKMEQVSKSGRTVLFVSHDIEAVSVLCSKGVLLDTGSLIQFDDIHSIINTYSNQYQDSFKTWDYENRPGDNFVKLNNIKLIDINHNQIYQAKIDQEFGISVEFEVLQDDVKPAPNFHFFSTTNTYCFVAISDVELLQKGIYKSVIWIPGNLLNNQVYKVGIALTNLKIPIIHLYEKEIINLEVIEDKSKRKTEYGGLIPGVLRPELKSELKLISKHDQAKN